MTSNLVIRTIADRRSHRSFFPDTLTKEQISALITAALQAPSAVNRQPWHYTVVQDQSLLDEINTATRNQALSHENHSPRFESPSFQVFYHAPLVIFISGDALNSWTPIDCGIAVQTLALAAESLGLGSVILGLPREAFAGEHAQELEKKLSFPEGYHFVIAIAIGKPNDDKAPHPTNEAEKVTFIN